MHFSKVVVLYFVVILQHLNTSFFFFFFCNLKYHLLHVDAGRKISDTEYSYFAWNFTLYKICCLVLLWCIQELPFLSAVQQVNVKKKKNKRLGVGLYLVRLHSFRINHYFGDKLSSLQYSLGQENASVCFLLCLSQKSFSQDS